MREKHRRGKNNNSNNNNFRDHNENRKFRGRGNQQNYGFRSIQQNWSNNQSRIQEPQQNQSEYGGHHQPHRGNRFSGREWKNRIVVGGGGGSSSSGGGQQHQHQQYQQYQQQQQQQHYQQQQQHNSAKSFYVPPEENISITTLVKNDYNQHFVDTGKRPQNFIRDHEYNDRFNEFPKLKKLIELKDQLIEQRATPPMYLKCDLKTFNLTSLDCKFDVILIDPPWEEYCRRKIVSHDGHDGDTPFWSVDEIGELPIGEISASPSFLFLWVGNSKGLEEGRQLLSKWGFRRAEDIVWIKTNHEQYEDKRKELNTSIERVVDNEESVFVSTKEHCLMGIKGTVRRNQDGHIIHTNIDTDVIIAEEPPHVTWKPDELYHIIEHFCLGRRRLELFGEDHNIRKGWLTLGSSLTSSNFNKEKYFSNFDMESECLVGSTADIEELRPKSPPRKVPIISPSSIPSIPIPMPMPIPIQSIPLNNSTSIGRGQIFSS